MSWQESPRLDRSRCSAPGFALPELGALVFVAALGLALLIPALNDTRRQAGLGRDIVNLRQIGQWTGMYAADNDGVYWTFSWEAGHQNSQWPDLNMSTSNVQAAATQAIDIIRRRTGRHTFPVPGGWLPHSLYSYLPLVDYLDRQLPDFAFISTADTYRLMWAADPFAFDQGAFLPFQPLPTNRNKRWPYSSSHRLATSFFDGSPVGARISQFNAATWSIPGLSQMGGQPLHNVVFPSHKVHINFSESRHFNTYLFCVADGARLPLLMADGSIQIHNAQDANPGWQPNTPSSGQPTVLTYTPRIWEAPTSTGEPTEEVIGRFLWTRDFLAGIDFDGRGPRRTPSDAASDDEGIASARKQREGRVFSP